MEIDSDFLPNFNFNKPLGNYDESLLDFSKRNLVSIRPLSVETVSGKTILRQTLDFIKLLSITEHLCRNQE
jgi:hypothetical protein